jgi:hypothetical protein
MNGLFGYAYADAFAACAVGTGTTPTFRDSGATTISVTSGVATASGSFFEAGDVNRRLKLDSGEEYKITGFTSVTEVAVTGWRGAGDAVADEGTVWYVEQTGLASEQKRTATYLTGTGNCGSSAVGPTITMLRTFDFTAEVGPVNYTELGFSNTLTVGNNLFARTLVAGGTVTVLAGQALRVRYELSVTVGPTTPQPGAPAITGWPIAPATTLDGDGQATRFAAAVNIISEVNTSGATGGAKAWDPASAKGLSISTTSSLPAFGTSFSMGTSAMAAATAASYVSGSFQRKWSGTIAVAAGVGTAWRAAVFHIGGDAGFNTYAFLWDEAQTKDNLHTLTLEFEMVLTRPLVNP